MENEPRNLTIGTLIRAHGQGGCNTASYRVLYAIMSTLKTISFRMRSGAVEILDALAESLDRDRSYLLNEAVEHYLELNAYHAKLMAKGLRAAKEGKFVAHAEVKKMIQKTGRSK
jgi:predicted transcriptional regulator